MGISYKVGTFQPRTGTGTQDITDVGFQPKALMIWTTCTSNQTYRSSIYFSYGFSDGTTDCSVAASYNDNVGTSATESNVHDDSIIQVIETSGSYYARATVDSFLSNGFRLSWSVNSGISGAEIKYVAIGGDDITNVKVGTQSIGTTTTGNKAYTGVGFQGDLLLTATSNFLPTASAYTYNTTTEAHGGIQLGCAKSSTERWTVSTVSEDGRTRVDAWRYKRVDKCFAYLDNTTGGLLAEADFVSWGSDGFTFNYTTNTTANNQNGPFIYMALKGGVWDIGYFQSPATNTTVQVNTTAGSGNTLKGIFTVDEESNLITSTTISTSSIFDIGASDGTNTHSTSICDNDNADPSVSVGISSSTYLIWQFVAAATEASSTLVGRCTVSFAQNSFTTTWSNVDGAQRYLPYFALSELPAAGPEQGIINETAVSVGAGSLVKLVTKPIPDPSVSIGAGAVTGIKTLVRAITTEPPISVGAGTLTRLRTIIKSISDSPVVSVGAGAITRLRTSINSISDTPSVTVSESLAKVWRSVKSISETPSISVSESLVKILYAIRSISATDEPSISVSELLTGSLGLIIKNITETSVSVGSEQLAKIKTIIKTISDTPTISTSEQLARIPTFVKTISDTPIITTSEQLARIPTFVKTISDTPTITTSDSIARWISISYAIAEPSVSISAGTIQGALFYLRTITESPSITVSETLVRIQSIIKSITEEPQISVSETLARIQTILKSISEDAISTPTDNIVSIMTYTALIVESSRIKWYYSLLTRKMGAP